jgi:hypothetical protein
MRRRRVVRVGVGLGIRRRQAEESGRGFCRVVDVKRVCNFCFRVVVLLFRGILAVVPFLIRGSTNDGC